MSEPSATELPYSRRFGGLRRQLFSGLLGTSVVLTTGICPTGLLAGTVDELAMHWSMEPWSDSIGELQSDVSGDTATLASFPGDGSEWTTGILGRALVFDGIDRHLEHGVALPRAEGTIGHWLRPSVATGTRVALYESDFSGAASPDYNGFGAAGEALEIHTGVFDGDYYAVWQDGGVDARREVRGGTVSANAWTHVAVTWQIPGEMKLYVNCIEVDSVAMDAAFEGRTSSEYFLGKPSQFDGRHWPGAVDEVKVWDQAFTANGVRNHFCPRIRRESDTLAAEIPTAGDRFGASIAMSGEWLMVRSPGSSEVSWYRWRGMAGFQFHSAKPSVFADALSSNPETPKPLDVSGPVAAVANAGGVDVFELDTAEPASWNLVTTLSVPGADNFGFAVSASGDRVAIGAPTGDGGGVHVFERDQGGVGAWGSTLSDTDSGFSVAERYGKLVDLDGDLLAVYRQSVSLLDTTDIIDILRRDELGGVAGWVPEGDFSAGGDSIVSLAVRGDRIAIGVVEPADGENAIIVRRRDQDGPDQWGVEHVLIASDADTSDRLGANLAWLDEETLAAAALGTDVDHQAVYVFRMGGSVLKDQETLLVQRTFDPITSIGASLGTSLTGTGDLVVAGAPWTGLSLAQAPDRPGFSGRLHLFDLSFIFNDRFESENP